MIMASSTVMKSVEIAPNVHMPMMGIGTWQIRDKDTIFKILDSALECGYRLVDTAQSYGNELFLGEALQTLLPKYELERKDIFITSKLQTTNQGQGKAYESALRSLANLKTTYLDLFIIHFPGVSGLDNRDPRILELRKGSWLDLEKLKNEGKFKAIGVSNYMIRHLENLRTYATIWPASLNQCEYHPHHKPDDLVRYCRENGIHFQAYSSLGTSQHKDRLLNDPVIKQLASKYECSVVQLLLAWALNQGISVIPKTTNPDHVRSNLKALDIVISSEDMDAISKLDIAERYCWDPESVI